MAAPKWKVRHAHADHPQVSMRSRLRKVMEDRRVTKPGNFSRSENKQMSVHFILICGFVHAKGVSEIQPLNLIT